MSLGVSFPQDHDCDAYSRHHRMLRDQRSNGDHSRQNQDVEGSKMILGAESRIHFDENKKETLIKGKVARKGTLKPDWNTLRTQYSGNMDRERSKDAIDYVDWYAVRRADVKDISNAIILRGMNKKLAKRIKVCHCGSVMIRFKHKVKKNLGFCKNLSLYGIHIISCFF